MSGLKILIFSSIAWSLVSNVWTCGCRFNHPQNQYCNSDIVASVFVNSSRKMIWDNGILREFREKSETIPITTSIPTTTEKPVNCSIYYLPTPCFYRPPPEKRVQYIPADDINSVIYEFKIKILKSYKGGLRRHSYHKMYSSGSCGTYLPQRRYYYIMASRSGDGSLRIMLCYYQLDVTDVDAVTSRYIKNNIQRNWKKGCKSNCHFRSREPDQGPDSNVCFVDFEVRRNRDTTYCVRSKDQTCTVKHTKGKVVSTSTVKTST